MKKVYNIYADCGDYEDSMGISFDNEQDAKEFCEIFQNSKNISEDRVFTGKLFYEESYQYNNLLDYMKHNNLNKCIEHLKGLVKDKLDDLSWNDLSKREEKECRNNIKKYSILIKELQETSKENDDELSI